jgi:regulatory protein
MNGANSVNGAGQKTITAIEPQQRAKDRVNIFLDGQFALGVNVDVVAALHLGVGQRISEEHLARIVREETLAKAKDRAFLLLSYRARTEKEIRDRLNRAGYEPEIVEEVIAKLYELNFLDDQDFAAKYVEHRMGSRPVGRRALTWEMRRKGLDADTVAEATSTVDDEAEREAARQAAQSRIGKMGRLDHKEARQRLSGFLQRRGFAWDTIRCVIDEILPSDNDV